MSSLPPLPRSPLDVESPLPSPPPCRRLACCLLAASFTRDEDSTPFISMARWIALLTTRVVIQPKSDGMYKMTNITHIVVSDKKKCMIQHRNHYILFHQSNACKEHSKSIVWTFPVRWEEEQITCLSCASLVLSRAFDGKTFVCCKMVLLSS